MRWLIVFILLDLAFLGWLIGSASRPESADFVFSQGSEHRFLDPQRATWAHDLRIIDGLFEPLLRVDPSSLTLEPAAAERYEISSDRLIYAFYLRPEARFSNGDPVTARDFVSAWQRGMMPDLAADYSQLFWCIAGAEGFFRYRSRQLVERAKSGLTDPASADRLWQQAIAEFDRSVGIQAIDAHVLQVRLKRPTPYFLDLMAMAFFAPEHRPTIRQATQIDPVSGRRRLDPYWTSPGRLVGNGPYRLARRRFKRDLLLSANEYYWNAPAVRSKTILERIVPHVTTQLLMYQAGEVDYLPDLPSAGSLAADLVVQQRSDVHIQPKAGVYFYSFNCSPKRPDGSINPLADVRVRQALSLAIDRKLIVQQVTRLHQPIARTYVPPDSIPGYQPPGFEESTMDQDLAKARTLLAEAGYGGGHGLTGLSILYNNGMNHELIAQQIKRQWEDSLGVAVTLQGVEGASFGDRLRQRQYTIARASWFGDYPDATTFLDKFRSENGNNDAAYGSAEYDRLLDEAENTIDVARRSGLMRQAEALLLNDQPIAPIYQYVFLEMYDARKVHGIDPNAWNFHRLDRIERIKR